MINQARVLEIYFERTRVSTRKPLNILDKLSVSTMSVIITASVQLVMSFWARHVTTLTSVTTTPVQEVSATILSEVFSAIA